MTGKLLISILLRVLFGLMLFGTCVPASAQQPPTKVVSATVQPSTVTVGDSVAYQISIVLTGAGQPSVAIPVMDEDSGLSTPSPAGTQTSVESYIANGGFRSVQRITYNYTIRTSKEGRFTIPPATITINGKTYETDPVDVEVRALPKAANVPAELEGLVIAPRISGNPELQRKLTGVVFVLPVLSTNEPYNGEQVRLSYHLVIDRDALIEAGLQPRTNLDGVTIPSLNEFIAEVLYPFPQDLEAQEREIGGNLYHVYPVYEVVIASTRTGSLQIEPFQISMLFSMQNQGTRGRTPFDDDPFFSSITPFSRFGRNSVQVIAQSPPLTLDVKPVPQQGRPANFGGAVGEFSIQAEVDRTAAKAYDELIGLDVTIEGRGNTDSLSAPELPSMPGFTVLGEPEQQTTGRKDGDDYISVKKFSYTLRPTTPGSHTIPPVVLSYFNPETREFAKASSDVIPVEISPGSRPAPPPPAASQADEGDESAEPAAEPDLRYISNETLQRPGQGGLFSGTSGAVMFLVPPALLAMAGFVAWNRNRLQHRQVDPSRIAGAASSIHLKEARQALDAGDTTRMAAELATGMRLFFASRFGISEAEATIPEIEERLARNGAPGELIHGISSTLETCDSAQYAPGSASATVASDLYDSAASLMKSAEAYV